MVVLLMHMLFKEAWMLRSVWVSRADVAWNKLKTITEIRRTIARLSMLYKMRNRLVFYEDIKLQPVHHLYSTRSKDYSYKQPIATRDYYKYSFYPRTISEWNNLPREIVFCSSLAAFKNAFFNIFNWPFWFLFYLFIFLERCKMLSIEWKTYPVNKK